MGTAESFATIYGILLILTLFFEDDIKRKELLDLCLLLGATCGLYLAVLP